jgi:hypothetical protein
LGFLNLIVRCVAVLLLGLAACSSTPKTAAPPANFPDLSAFTVETASKFNQSGKAFVSPQQISCVLDFGSDGVTVCNGNIRGVPESVPGIGCVSVRKHDPATRDAPYVFEHTGRECASSRRPPIEAGRKLVGKNSTCVVGDDGLVACIDADNQHGFVLKPSGSGTF